MHWMERDWILTVHCNQMIDIYMSAVNDVHLTCCVVYLHFFFIPFQLQNDRITCVGVFACNKYPIYFVQFLANFNTFIE